MGSKRHSNLLLCYFSAVLFFTGCAPQIKRPMRICPGKDSVEKSLSLLQVYAEDTKPFKANGQCLAKFYADGKKKPQKEHEKQEILSRARCCMNNS